VSPCIEGRPRATLHLSGRLRRTPMRTRQRLRQPPVPQRRTVFDQAPPQAPVETVPSCRPTSETTQEKEKKEKTTETEATKATASDKKEKTSRKERSAQLIRSFEPKINALIFFTQIKVIYVRIRYVALSSPQSASDSFATYGAM